MLVLISRSTVTATLKDRDVYLAAPSLEGPEVLSEQQGRNRDETLEVLFSYFINHDMIE
jgi:hypothetical protein